MQTRFFRFLGAALLGVAPLCAAHAQLPAMMTRQEVQALSTGYYTAYEYKNTMAKAALTPEQAYFTPDWQPGTLWTTAGDKRPVGALRYNIALRLVEVRDPASPTGLDIVPVGGLRGFTLGPEGKPGSRTFEARQEQHATNSRNFFEVLTAGPTQLLLLHEVTQKESNWTPASNTETKPASVGRITRLFVAPDGQNDVRELALKRKAIDKLFGAQAPKVASFAASKNLNYEDISDLGELVDYYNSLVKSSQP